MNFGRHHDLTVQNLLDLKKHPYLRWVYFNSSNITFMDNILETIGVKEQFKIHKPGTHKELGEAILELNLSYMGGLRKHILGLRRRSKYIGDKGASSPAIDSKVIPLLLSKAATCVNHKCKDLFCLLDRVLLCFSISQGCLISAKKSSRLSAALLPISVQGS